MISFLGIKGGENRHWSLTLIEKVTVLFDLVKNFIVLLKNIYPLLILDELSSFSQMLDDLSIVVGHCDLSNPDNEWFIDRFFFITLIFDFLASLFQFILNIKFKLRAFIEQASGIAIILFPVLICLSVKIELNCVITCSDCFDIPINILGNLDCFDVVNIYLDEEISKQSDTAHHQSEE